MRIPLLLSLSVTALCAQQPLAIEAPIVRVRLHPDEAWVTRAGRARLATAGTHRIRLEGLPPGLRIEDLQVSAKGTAGLRLGDLSVASDVRTVTETAEWKRLEAERDGLRERRDALEAQGEAVQGELAFLRALQATHDKELSSRMTYSAPNAAGILELGKSLQGRIAELLTGERKRRRGLEKLSREEARVDAELRKRSSERQTAPSRVTVELTTAQEGYADVELSYRTRTARWRPLYEARLSENRSRLDLVLFAAITQKSGEPWNGVRLEISNARPGRNLAVPAYSTGRPVDWMKQPPPPPPSPIGLDEPIQLKMETAQAYGAVQNLQVPAPVPASDTSTLIEEASGLAATFLLDGAKDVPSDDEPHRFKVHAQDLEPSLTLFTTPRLDPTAYLLARFPAPQGLPLFPGSPVVRFAGNQRLGEAPLAVPDAGQPFSLGFGPYKSVRTSLRRVDWKLEQAGTFTKERLWTVREAIELTNDGAETLDVEVQDRMLTPVSDQVKITLLPGFAGGWTEPVPGVRSWKFKLGPKEQKRLDMPVTVRAPKEGLLTGLDDLLPQEP